MRAVAIPLVRVAAPTEPVDYERVLIPVFISGPGAQGARWETAVTIASTADEDVQLARRALLYEQDRFCAPTCADRVLVTDEAAHLPRAFEHPAGLMLWVPRSMDRNDLHVNIRVRDAAKNATSAGTFVPLVREDDLSTGRIVLLDVPVGADFRASLRLYDLYLETIPRPTSRSTTWRSSAGEAASLWPPRPSSS